METLKLLFLFPPCISIISDKIRIFFERRIVMRRKHFGMSVDIHTRSLRLFKKHFQIVQVMSRNKDTRIFADSDINFCDLRISVSCCISLVKKFHHTNAEISCLESQCGKFFCRESIIRCYRKCFLEKRVDLLIRMCKCCCMFRIGCQSFQTVGDQFSKTSDIFILCGKNSYVRSFIFKSIFCTVPECSFREIISVFDFFQKFFFDLQRFFDSCNDRFFIKICICDRCKQIYNNLMIDIIIYFFSFASKLCGHC